MASVLNQFRDLMTEGSQWTCTNYLHPKVNGSRTITKAGRTVLSYAFETADGREAANGRLEVPKASNVVIDGDTVHFLWDSMTQPNAATLPALPDGRLIAYTWTKA